MPLLRTLLASLWLTVLASLVASDSAVRLVSAASTADRLHLTHGTDATGQPQITLGIDPAEGFTLLIATYQRDLLLPPLLKHLTSSPPPSLRQILVIWQNVDSALPEFLSPSALDEYSTSGVAVSVRKSWKNSMNERFRPVLDWGHEIATDAVMILDDDVVLRRDALEWGYEQFVEANRYGPGRIVGFSPRDFELVAEDADPFASEYITKPRASYSMILSNAAFLKKEWLVKYWEDSPEMRGLRDYVDSVFNCDDILINYVVSNLTGSPPLLLQPATPLRTIPTEGGLWNRVAVDSASSSSNSTSTPSGSVRGDTITTSPPRPEHFSTRKECLSHYFTHFSRHAPSMASNSTLPPSSRSHYPLVKTRTSISQDVEDHSRWMFNNEMWETVVWSDPVARANPEEDDEADEEGWSDEEDDLLKNGDYDKFLEGLSDEEVDELLKSLDDVIATEVEEDAEAVSPGAAEDDGGVVRGGEAQARHSRDEL